MEHWARADAHEEDSAEGLLGAIVRFEAGAEEGDGASDAERERDSAVRAEVAQVAEVDAAQREDGFGHGKGEHQVGAGPIECLDRIGAGWAYCDFETLLAQHVRQSVAEGFLVLNNEHPSHFTASLTDRACAWSVRGTRERIGLKEEGAQGLLEGGDWTVGVREDGQEMGEDFSC